VDDLLNLCEDGGFHVLEPDDLYLVKEKAPFLC